MQIPIFAFAGLSFLSSIMALYIKDEERKRYWQFNAIWEILVAILICLVVIAFERK